MPFKTLDLDLAITGQDPLAHAISDKYVAWKNLRTEAEKTWGEVRQYVFATSTRGTANALLPWKNKTHRPKLCQIRDNLHANYMSALFPNDRWFQWEAEDPSSNTRDIKLAVETYMRHKLRDSGFEDIISRLLLDWIDTGNCFADVRYVSNKTMVNGVQTVVYSGPQLIRISPLDIVFDITGQNFTQVPKITRTLLSFGELEKYRKTLPEWSQFTDEVLTRLKNNRLNFANAKSGHLKKADLDKAKALTADGFASLFDYYNSDYVEILEFEGDFYDRANDKLYENHYIVVADRAFVVAMQPAKSWFGVSTKAHCGWRLRSDNLMAMGPLDNLVGLQYRIDHLENLKADVFDLIAFPVQKVKGMVEDYIYQPNEQIYMEQDADVEFMSPDTTALNADLQIQVLEQTMEEMAGAPKQAMGVRTPGEKTAYEVSALENAASRIFQIKITYFEKMFLEPLLNAFLESARRNLDAPEVYRTINDELGFQQFIEISPETIQAAGKLVAKGSRHFAASAQLVQNLTNLTNSGMYQDPSINVHISGKKIAELIEDNLGLTRFQIFSPNIRVLEQAETQLAINQAQEEIAVTSTADVTTPEVAEVEDDDEGESEPAPAGAVV